MREIRDKLSLDIMEMTFEQEMEYIKKQLDDLKAIKQRKKAV